MAAHRCPRSTWSARAACPATGTVAERTARRVRSFTARPRPEAVVPYTFNNLRPGTYLYQSGTHPQVQVQMGLAGMVRQDATLAGSTGRLLFANAAAGFDADVPVVFSEVDVAQHILIDSTLGSLNPASWKAGNNSTLNYAPNFFLVNGRCSTAPPPPTFRSARRPAPAWCCAWPTPACNRAA